MKRLIVFIPLLLLFAVFVFNAATAPTFPKSVAVVVKPTSTPTPSPFSEDKLWSLIQKWRTDNGFQPYIKDQRLCAIAKDRVTNDPVLDNHEGFIRKVESHYYSFIAPSVQLQENLANYPSEQMMLKGWLGSPAHKATLEKPYAYSCIECRYLNNQDHDTYCSQIFSNF